MRSKAFSPWTVVQFAKFHEPFVTTGRCWAWDNVAKGVHIPTKLGEKMKKDAAEWARELGVLILDPDGWRKGSEYGPLSMDIPITREEFYKRASLSTIMPRMTNGF